MSILNEVARVCEKATLEMLRVPVLAKVPRHKYDELVEQMKGIIRLPLKEMVPGKNGWRMETSEEYNERINRRPNHISLTLATGTLQIVPYNGTDIEVEFEKEN